MTCLSALEDGRAGTAGRLVNASKGCGGVMRVAPAGLAGLPGRDPFALGGLAEVSAALAAAMSAAADGPPSTEAMCRLGEGWVAEEALAVAVYCALTAPDFRAGVLLAVNHGGDSDSTGAICGNLLGASLGAGAIDADLLDGLEGRDVITQVADDLYDTFAAGQEPSRHRYPG